MGNFDRWSTPKGIKIERKGDPRPLRRGLLKKGERRKGQKARIDELMSSKKTLEKYAQWIQDERQRRIDHPEWFIERPGVSFFQFHHEKWFDEHVKKHTKLLAAALKDGVIEEVYDWWVWKP